MEVDLIIIFMLNVKDKLIWCKVGNSPSENNQIYNILYLLTISTLAQRSLIHLASTREYKQ